MFLFGQFFPQRRIVHKRSSLDVGKETPLGQILHTDAHKLSFHQTFHLGAAAYSKKCLASQDALEVMFVSQ